MNDRWTFSLKEEEYPELFKFLKTLSRRARGSFIKKAIINYYENQNTFENFKNEIISELTKQFLQDGNIEKKLDYIINLLEQGEVKSAGEDTEQEEANNEDYDAIRAGIEVFKNM